MKVMNRLLAAAGLTLGMAGAAQAACTKPDCGIPDPTAPVATAQAQANANGYGGTANATAGSAVINNSVPKFTGGVNLNMGVSGVAASTDACVDGRNYLGLFATTNSDRDRAEACAAEREKRMAAIAAAFQSCAQAGELAKSADAALRAVGVNAMAKNCAGSGFSEGLDAAKSAAEACVGGTITSLGICVKPVTPVAQPAAASASAPLACTVPPTPPRGKVMSLCMKWSNECPKRCLDRGSYEVRKVGVLDVQPNGTRGANASDLRLG